MFVSFSFSFAFSFPCRSSTLDGLEGSGGAEEAGRGGSNGGMVESGKNFLLDGRGGRAGTIGEGTVACIQTDVVRTAGLACFGLQPQL